MKFPWLTCLVASSDCMYNASGSCNLRSTTSNSPPHSNPQVTGQRIHSSSQMLCLRRCQQRHDSSLLHHTKQLLPRVQPRRRTLIIHHCLNSRTTWVQEESIRPMLRLQTDRSNTAQGKLCKLSPSQTVEACELIAIWTMQLMPLLKQRLPSAVVKKLMQQLLCPLAMNQDQ